MKVFCNNTSLIHSRILACHKFQAFSLNPNYPFTISKHSKEKIPLLMRNGGCRSLRSIGQRVQSGINTKKNMTVYSSVQPAGAPLPSSPPSNSWKPWIVGMLLTIFLPFLKSKWGPLLKFKEEVETVVETAEHITDVIENVAEKVEKVAEEVADHLPEGGKLKGVVTFVENVAKETAEDAHRVEEVIDKAEASMNALALKKFVEENQKLATECTNLVSQCSKLERECSLYDHDREALMDFGNEADERAKEAEIRVHELEEELRRMSDELRYYKQECEMRMDDSSTEGTAMEEQLLQSVLAALISKDEVAQSAHAFLNENSGNESCQRLLKMWNCLRPSTQKVLSLAAEVEKLKRDKEQKVLSLAAEVKTLEKDKEHLRINLHRAEEEVKLLFEENNILDEENKRLLRQCHKERNHPGSGGKHTSSASAKGNKRKSSPKTSSPIERMADYNDLDSTRQPLSPLQHNSPDCRMHKK